MVNQQLVDYIKQQLQGGVQRDAIKKALLDAGWPETEVEDSLSAAGASGATVSAVSQSTTVNPSAAMGGSSELKTISASSQDKFFSSPAASSEIAPAVGADSSAKIIMIVMGVVILVLLGAVGFMYWSSKDSARLNAQPGAQEEIASLQSQLQNSVSEKEALASQITALNADNKTLLQEVGVFVPGTATSSEITVSGILKASNGIYSISTPHGIYVVVKNSKDLKVDGALKGLVGQTVELKGAHKPGTAEISVISINGASPESLMPAATSSTSTAP